MDTFYNDTDIIIIIKMDRWLLKYGCPRFYMDRWCTINFERFYLRYHCKWVRSYIHTGTRYIYDKYRIRLKILFKQPASLLTIAPLKHVFFLRRTKPVLHVSWLSRMEGGIWKHLNDCKRVHWVYMYNFTSQRFDHFDLRK